MTGLPDSVVAGLIGLVAAFFGALGSVLQARAVLGTIRPESELRAAMLLTLVRRPLWLAGVGIAGLGFAFHAWALGEASLVEIEPLMVLSLVFALPLGGWLCRQPVGRREWLAALGVIVGLLVFLLSADPVPGTRNVGVFDWLVMFAIVVVTMGMCVVIGLRATRPATVAVLFGTAAAIGLAAGAVIMKSWTGRVDDHGFAAFIDWRLAVLAVGGVVVLTLQQSAYRAGPFAAALSPMIGLNPILAGILGFVVYGDRIHSQLDRSLLALVGIALVAAGLARLARAPAITLDGLSGEAPPDSRG